MSDSDSDSDERANSMCAFYADIIEHELSTDDTDMEVVERMLQNIRKYCQTVAYEPGETPEHLEEHLYEKK